MPSSRRFKAEDILKNPSAYDVLGVPSNASQEQVMRAYRYSLQSTHPDGGQPVPYKRYPLEVVRASFEILRDAELRRQYDAGLAKAKKLAMRAQMLKGINDNAHVVEDRAESVVSSLGAIFWPFHKK